MSKKTIFTKKLKNVIINTINKIGLHEFKKTSIFGSNKLTEIPPPYKIRK